MQYITGFFSSWAGTNRPGDQTGQFRLLAFLNPPGGGDRYIVQIFFELRTGKVFRKEYLFSDPVVPSAIPSSVTWDTLYDPGTGGRRRT